MLQTRYLVLVLATLLASGSHWGGLDRNCLAPAEAGVVEAAPSGSSLIVPQLVPSSAARLSAVRMAPPRMTPVTAPPSLGESWVSGWDGEKVDNICGIDDLKKVSKPAEVDYPDLMASTPQMIRIEKDGIDPDSPQGKLLRQEAVRLITKSCEVVRRRKGYCGIWKSIAHEDKRSVPNATSDVKDEMN